MDWSEHTHVHIVHVYVECTGHFVHTNTYMIVMKVLFYFVQCYMYCMNTLYIVCQGIPHKHGLAQDMYSYDSATYLTVLRSSSINLPSSFIFGYPLIPIITSHSLWRDSSDEWDRRCRNKRSLASTGALFSILKDTLLGMTSFISSLLAIARASIPARNLSLYFSIIVPH